MKSKKIISIILTTILTLSSCIVGASAESEKNNLLKLTVVPEKTEYEKGETVTFSTIIINNSIYTLDNVVIWMETESDGVYLVPGVTERDYDSMAYGASYDGSFSVEANETVVKIGETAEKFGTSPSALVSSLIKLYMRISKMVVSVRQQIENIKNGNIFNLFKTKNTETLYNTSVVYDGKTINCTFKGEYIVSTERNESTVEKQCETDNAYTIEATVKAENNALNGIVFSSEIKDGDFTGGLFYIDCDTSSAGVATVTEDGTRVLAQKYITIEDGKSYKVKLSYNDGYIKGYVYYNELDNDPYPIFDIYTKFNGTDAGTYRVNKSDVTDFILTDDEVTVKTGNTYTNPVYNDSPDPFILYEDGTYYLYATNRSDGFDVSTSTDLINWTNRGACALSGDIIGTYWFWAPEVYKYNGKFYLLYSTEEHLALAVADSPMGPFKKTSDDFIFEDSSIDGHIFFDDNGKQYLYYAYFSSDGEQIWVCELDENLNIKPETNTKLTSPSGWEGSCNEGPFVLKHNGYYYLTYSGETYTCSVYSVGVAVSKSPTGPFVKQKNPILYHTAFLSGPGHHCFTYSPSGELMIAYHCHYSLTRIHNRKLCIDKAKFVPTESGIDELVIYGPTSTEQDIPE